MKTKLLIPFLLFSFFTNAQITPDATFGINGKVITSLNPGSDGLTTMVIQPDGKILTCGATPFSSAGNVVLVRYNSNGTLDASFGVEGKVYTTLVNETAYGQLMALQNDGKIVVVSSKATINDFDKYNFAVARFNSDGTPDNTFGGDGIVETDFEGKHDEAQAVKIQSDNKILVGGSSRHSGSFYGHFALARYNEDGSLDTTFGSGGKLSEEMGTLANSFDTMTCLLIQNDNKIIAAGNTSLADNNFQESNFALLRLNPNGSVDNTFGTGGKATTDIAYAQYGSEDVLYSVALTPENGIVAVGYHQLQYDPDYEFQSTNKTAIAKYDSNGILDSNFGTAGVIMTDFLNDHWANYFWNVVSVNDKFYCTGTIYTEAQNGPNMLLTRYNGNGTLDTTFDSDGIFIPETTGVQQAASMAFLPDNKMIFAGWAGTAFDQPSDALLLKFDMGALSTNNFNSNPFVAYPNPFTNHIEIDFGNAQTENISVGLFDLNGRKIQQLLNARQSSIGQNTIELDMPETLSKGIYFLKITNGKETSTIKIMK